MRKFKLPKNLFQILLNFYIILFIFTMFNREYLFFGFDPRFIQLPLGIIILGINIFSKKFHFDKKKNDNIGQAMIAFYAYTFISNIAWLWNGLNPNTIKLINELILITNVSIGLLVFYFNSQRLNSNIIITSAIISCFILSISILLVHQGFTLAQISGSPDAHYISQTVQGVNNNNLFGEKFRCAGYASDPNYATILLLIGIICVLKSKLKRIPKTILFMLFSFCICLSFSRTVILAVIVCGIYVITTSFIKLKTITKIKLNRLLIVTLILATFIIALLPTLTEQLPATLSTRGTMWQNANQLFWQSPFFGNGITSFRSSFLAAGHWFVQAHSTYWQIIAELGIIGIVLYYRIVLRALNYSSKTPLNYFLTLVFLIWIFTCETIALPFSIMIYFIIDNGLLDQPRNINRKNALFFINSLQQGGAEKACLNLADELIKEDYKVDFIVISSNQKQTQKYTIYNLKHKQKNKIIRTLHLLAAIPRVNDYITARQLEQGNYALITSHLPMSNIVTRLSCVRHQAIYVIHTTMNSYSFGPKRLYRKIVKIFFQNHKIVAVSKGLQKELVQQYHLSKKNVKTIYNPIDISTIKKSATSKRPFKEPYFLHVGRFEKGKRQDLMLQIFKAGHFDQKYHLIFCGTGSTLDNLKSQEKTKSPSEKIHFMGYQDNIYKWMKHAEILISTSSFEAFPMNLVEAFACDTKVISSDCDFGPREILLDNYAQFLVSPIDDTQQYIKKIKIALKKYPKTKNPIIKQLQPTTILQKYLTFYNK